MAIKSIYHDLDLNKVSQILNTRIHNITTSARTTLGGTLNSTHKGLIVLDTDLDEFYYWNGSAWSSIGALPSGAMTFKGVVAFGATEPSTPATGDFYVFSTAGTNTWEGSTPVQVGDSAVWDGTAWQFIQGNAVASSETIAGLIEIATQSETNTGSDDTRAITPAKLSSWATSKAFAKTYYVSPASVVADTPLTITHNLALQNRNAFVINVMGSDNSQVSVDVDSVDTNSLTITSSIALTNPHVTVIGF